MFESECWHNQKVLPNELVIMVLVMKPASSSEAKVAYIWPSPNNIMVGVHRAALSPNDVYFI